jgi:hypothetical protein
MKKADMYTEITCYMVAIWMLTLLRNAYMENTPEDFSMDVKLEIDQKIDSLIVDAIYNANERLDEDEDMVGEMSDEEEKLFPPKTYDRLLKEVK